MRRSNRHSSSSPHTPSSSSAAASHTPTSTASTASAASFSAASPSSSTSSFTASPSTSSTFQSCSNEELNSASSSSSSSSFSSPSPSSSSFSSPSPSSSSSSSSSSSPRKPKLADYVNEYLVESCILIDARDCDPANDTQLRPVRQSGVNRLRHSAEEHGWIGTMLVTVIGNPNTMSESSTIPDGIAALLKAHIPPVKHSLYRQGQWWVVDGGHRCTAICQLYAEKKLPTPFIQAQLLSPYTPQHIRLLIAYGANESLTNTVRMSLYDELRRIYAMIRVMTTTKSHLWGKHDHTQAAKIAHVLDQSKQAIAPLQIPKPQPPPDPKTKKKGKKTKQKNQIDEDGGGESEGGEEEKGGESGQGEKKSGQKRQDSNTRHYATLALALKDSPTVLEYLKVDADLEVPRLRFTLFNSKGFKFSPTDGVPPLVRENCVQRVLGLPLGKVISAEDAQAILFVAKLSFAQIATVNEKKAEIMSKRNIAVLHSDESLKFSTHESLIWSGTYDKQLLALANSKKHGLIKPSNSLIEEIELELDIYGLTWEEEQSFMKSCETTHPRPNPPYSHSLTQDQLDKKEEMRLKAVARKAAEEKKLREQIELKESNKRKRSEKKKKKKAVKKARKQQENVDRRKAAKEAADKKKVEIAAAKEAAAKRSREKQEILQRKREELREKKAKDIRDKQEAQKLLEEEKELELERNRIEAEAESETQRIATEEFALQRQEEEVAAEPDADSSSDSDEADDENDDGGEGQESEMKEMEESNGESNFGYSTHHDDDTLNFDSNSMEDEAVQQSMEELRKEQERSGWLRGCDEQFRLIHSKVEDWLVDVEVMKEFEHNVDLVFLDPPWQHLTIDSRKGPVAGNFLPEDRITKDLILKTAVGISRLLKPQPHATALICLNEASLTVWREALEGQGLFVEPNTIIVVKSPRELNTSACKTSGLVGGAFFVMVVHTSTQVLFNRYAVAQQPITHLRGAASNVLLNYEPPSVRLMKPDTPLHVLTAYLSKNPSFNLLSSSSFSSSSSSSTSFAEPEKVDGKEIRKWWMRISEKHPALWKTLFRRYANPGTVVANDNSPAKNMVLVELFMGTGSGALAAHQSAGCFYRYVGVESDKECVDGAQRRLYADYVSMQEFRAASRVGVLTHAPQCEDEKEAASRIATQRTADHELDEEIAYPSDEQAEPSTPPPCPPDSDAVAPVEIANLSVSKPTVSGRLQRLEKSQQFRGWKVDGAKQRLCLIFSHETKKSWSAYAFRTLLKHRLGWNWVVRDFTLPVLWTDEQELKNVCEEFIINADFIFIFNDSVDFAPLFTCSKSDYMKWHNAIYGLISLHGKSDLVYPRSDLGSRIAGKEYLMKLSDLGLALPTVEIKRFNNYDRRVAGDLKLDDENVIRLWDRWNMDESIADLIDLQKAKYYSAYNEFPSHDHLIGIHFKAGFSSNTSNCAHLNYAKVVKWGSFSDRASLLKRLKELKEKKEGKAGKDGKEGRMKVIKFLIDSFARGVDQVFMQIFVPKYANRERRYPVMNGKVIWEQKQNHDSINHGHQAHRSQVNLMARRLIEAKVFGLAEIPMLWRFDLIYVKDGNYCLVGEVEVCGAEYQLGREQPVLVRAANYQPVPSEDDVDLMLPEETEEEKAYMSVLAEVELYTRYDSKGRLKELPWIFERIVAHFITHIRLIYGVPVTESIPLSPPRSSTPSQQTQSSPNSSLAISSPPPLPSADPPPVTEWNYSLSQPSRALSGLLSGAAANIGSFFRNFYNSEDDNNSEADAPTFRVAASAQRMLDDPETSMDCRYLIDIANGAESVSEESDSASASASVHEHSLNQMYDASQS